MNILSFIQHHYGFQEMKWDTSGHRFATERGYKKVLLWDDFDLAYWHCEWRDRLEGHEEVFIDRMLSSKQGERIIKYEKQWLTCHDDSLEPYPIKGSEQIWGRFIGFLLSQSTFYQYHNLSAYSSKDRGTFDASLNSLRRIKQEKWESSFNILVQCLPSAKKRVEQSAKLAETTISHGLPYMPPLLPPTKGKQILGQLFWEAGQESPQVGFASLIQFLSSYLKETSFDCFTRLLDEIDRIYPLRDVHGKRIMADLIYPDEWITCLQALQSDDEPDGLIRIIEQFKKEWDEKSQCLGAIHRWLNKEEGEVAK